ncbi:hypothetical protein TL16_g07027 [Triparma laevis f. inornata]|uniref:ABC transporter domain-containing protein n=1 Tax=Triparma laevis f. inornata TaxID=1714386 RepID=A0A9W7AYK8_9STRA|nr:hypothetical protein TL16_g07027 [Triparma laevis f. inornata]
MIPIGFILQCAVPIALFYLFSQVWLPPETQDEALPGDVYTLDSYLKTDGGEDSGNPTNFLLFVEQGYTATTQPTCNPNTGQNQDGDWWVSNKDNFLLDCTPDSVSGFSWAAGAVVEDQCDTEGQVVYDSCQMKIIGLAPSDAKAGDSDVISLINEHKSYLEASFPASIGSHDLVKVFDSQADMIDYIEDEGYGNANNPLAAGIVWNGVYPDFDYTVRMNVTDSIETGKDFNDFDYYRKAHHSGEEMAQCRMYGKRGSINWWHPEVEAGSCGEKFVSTPFVKHFMIDSFLINKVSIDATGSPVDFIVHPSTAGFPSNEYVVVPFWEYLGGFFSTMIYLSFILTFYNTLKQLTEEKELKLTEGLKMMGVTDFQLAASWWVLFVSESLICTGLVMVTARTTYPESDLVIVFFYFFMFLMSCTSYCIFLSNFFDKAKMAGLVGFVIFLAGSFINTFVDEKFFRILVSMAHPATLYFYMTDCFVFFESRQIGVNSNTINAPISDPKALTAQDCFILYFFDTFLYVFLAWYVGKIMPSEFGVALPPYFIFMPSYWKTGEIWTPGDSASYSTVAVNDIDIINVEEVGEDLKRQEGLNECVQIKGLRKVYNTNKGAKVAVQDLSLNFYKNQISCLLGHNGAGKTTTISILNGLTKITAGDAKIGPHSVKTDMAAIRTKIGVCPQHDVLFKTLTVAEHLRLFATIKHIPSDKVEKLIVDILKDVGMPEKYSWHAAKLSGGQKRKLSLAIAFLGDSEIIFLDEPTSGMDPYSRRSTWDLIRKKKEGRVVVLTTHFMDEADLLGDRIAIMSEGALRCVGSSLFLKKEFGVGYNIIMEKNRSGRCDEAAIDRIIKESASEAKLLSAVGTEVSYQLPLEASSSFPKMLTTIEAQLHNLGLVSYGVSVTTLEEVFITIARNALHGDDDLSTQNHGADGNTQRNKVKYTKLDPSRTAAFFARHSTALLQKRFVIAKRDLGTVFASFIFPLFMIALGMYGTMLGSQQAQYESVPLVMENFTSSSTAKTPVYYNNDGLTDCLSMGWSYVCQPDWAEQEDGGEAGWGSCNFNDVSRGFQTQKHDYGERERNRAPPFIYGKTLEDELYQYGIYELDELVYNCSCDGIGDMVSTARVDNVEWFLVEGGDSGYAATVEEIGAALHNSREDYGESRFGAFHFTSTPSNPNPNPFHNATNDGDNTNKFRVDAKEFVEYVAMVNFTSAFALPSFVSYANEVIARTIDSTVTIKANIFPFPRTQTEMEVSESEATAGTVFMILFFLPFVPASFGAYAISERTSKSKHIQMVSGVTPFVYWLSIFVWDFACFCFSTGVMIILLYAFDISDLIAEDTIGVIIALLLAWGGAHAAFSYCYSFMFSSSLNNLGFTIFLSFILGYLASLVVYILGVVLALMKNCEESDDGCGTRDTILEVHDIMIGVGHFLPTFNLGLALQRIQNRVVISAVNMQGTDVYEPWDSHIAKDEVYWLLGCTPIYFLLCIFMQYVDLNPTVMASINGVLQRPIQSYLEVNAWDSDVVEENRKCEQLANGPRNLMPNILVNGLKKQYGMFNRCGAAKLAVKSVSFSVEPGTCFGLLGVNGAGKTSTLGMVTGEFAPSAGECFLAQKSIFKDSEEIKRIIGYCPQFDALFPLMTGREHLRFYARLKGVKEEFVEAVVEEQINRMDLRAHCDRTSKGYSGGNRRKLSVACALIGDPKIIFLDEPSTGMDPLARRFMWSIINQITNEKDTSVILTTHSMEECEALCGKLGIMVDGYFRTTFQHFEMLERQDNRLRLSLGSLVQTNGTKINIAQLFAIIENMKAPFKIKNYSISQTSLEQIFNQFAKLQMFRNTDEVHGTQPQVSPVTSVTSDSGEGVGGAGDGAGYLPPAAQGGTEIEMTEMGGKGVV